MSSEKLTEIYDLMHERFGGQNWWPGDSPFEVVVGAILTQNTNWTNVEKAITNLKDASALSPEKLHEMDTGTLAQIIRPAGYYNIKAKRLKNFIEWLFESYHGDIDRLTSAETDVLRAELLSVKGIGRETADSILLYALGKTVFVVDTYTCRILVRHGLIEPGADYEQVREFFEYNLPGDVQLFNEFHALIVRVGKLHCKPRPKCQGCPLESLPHEIEML